MTPGWRTPRASRRSSLSGDQRDDEIHRKIKGKQKKGLDIVSDKEYYVN